MKFAISQPKMVWFPRNERQIYQLNSRPQMWPLGLSLAMTLTFQGQIKNSLYLNQKWSDCHKMKSKHINWIIGLKCDQWVWQWARPTENKADLGNGLVSNRNHHMNQLYSGLYICIYIYIYIYLLHYTMMSILDLCFSDTLKYLKYLNKQTMVRLTVSNKPLYKRIHQKKSWHKKYFQLKSFSWNII